MSAKTCRSLRRHISSHPYRDPPENRLTICRQGEADFSIINSPTQVGVKFCRRQVLPTSELRRTAKLPIAAHAVNAGWIGGCCLSRWMKRLTSQCTDCAKPVDAEGKSL